MTYRTEPAARGFVTAPSSCCSLHAVAVELGELRRIEALPEFLEDQSLLQVFRERGLAYFSQSRLTPFELALRSVRACMAKTGIDPARIDAFILVTETQSANLMTSAAGMGLFLHEAGLTNAWPLVQHGAQCANLAYLLDVVGGLIATGRVRTALVTVVEMVRQGEDLGAQRFTLEPGASAAGMENGSGRLTGDLGLTVCSDGAATFLMTGDDDVAPPSTDSFDLAATAQRARPEMIRHLLRNEMDEVARINEEAIREVVDAALEAADVGRHDIARVLTNNCGLHIQSRLLASAGFEMERGFFDNIARFGHAFSVDNLANLADVVEKTRPAAGQTYLLLFNAAACWGAAILRHRDQSIPTGKLAPWN